MRWVTVGPTPPRNGGIVAHGLCLRRALAERGHQVASVGYSRLYPWWISTEFRAYQAPPSGGPQAIATIDALRPDSWASVGDCVSRWQPDVVLCEVWTPVAFPALRAVAAQLGTGQGAGPVRLAVVHNARPHEPFPAWRWLLARCLSQFDGVLCYSQHVAGQIQALSESAALADGGRLRLAKLGPLLEGADEAPPPELQGETFAAALASGVVLAPGPQRSYKGTAQLGAALDSLPANRRPHLLLAGPSTWRSSGRAQRLRSALGSQAITHVNRYLSEQELTWILRRAAVLALPYSRASQSGWPALARRFRLPVVASAVAGLVEEFQGASAAPGDCFALVSEGDRVGFGQALRRACDLRPQLPRAFPGDHLLQHWLPIAENLEHLALFVRPNVGPELER